MRTILLIIATAVAFACSPAAPAITFMRFDSDASCWYLTTEELDPDYWTDWVEAEECTAEVLYTADESGQCVKFLEDCEGHSQPPADPWLAGCTSYPDCCATAITNLPSCPTGE